MQNVLSVKIEKMYFMNGDTPTKAFCSIVLLDSFIVKGLRIVDGKEGLFVSMPSEQGKDGKWYETFSPVSRTIRGQLEEYVLEGYKDRVHEKKSE